MESEYKSMSESLIQECQIHNATCLLSTTSTNHRTSDYSLMPTTSLKPRPSHHSDADMLISPAPPTMDVNRCRDSNDGGARKYDKRDQESVHVNHFGA